MRNRTRVIAATALAAALAAGSVSAASASPVAAKAGAPAKTVSATKQPVPGQPVSKQPVDLAELAARLGVSPTRLEQALREVKTSLVHSGTTSPSQHQFEAALARVLGIPLAQVQQAMPTGPGQSKKIGAKGPGSRQGVNAAVVAAVASYLHRSTAQVNAALRTMLAAGRVDTSSPAFAAAARSLGVSAAQLSAALMHAKESLAGGKSPAGGK